MIRRWPGRVLGSPWLLIAAAYWMAYQFANDLHRLDGVGSFVLAIGHAWFGLYFLWAAWYVVDPFGTRGRRREAERRAMRRLVLVRGAARSQRAGEMFRGER